jgi:ferredoxin
MQVWIDGDLCTGVALCETSCPEVFVMVDDGIAHVVGPDGPAPSGVAVPFAEEYLEDVLEAAEGCPEDCIYIEA